MAACPRGEILREKMIDDQPASLLSKSITVTYAPTEKDRHEWNTYLKSELALTRKVTTVNAAIVTIGGGRFVYTLSNHAHSTHSALNSACFVVIFIACYIAAWIHSKRHIESTQVETQTVTIDDDILSYMTRDKAQRIPLRFVTMLERLPALLVIKTPDGYLYVPQRAFEDHKQFDALHTRMTELLDRRITPWPARRSIEGFPLAITYRLDRTDIIKVFWSSKAGKHFNSLEWNLAGTLAIALILGAFGFSTGFLSHRNGPIAMLPFLLSGIACFCYILLPSYPIGIANRYGEISQPRTVAAGSFGIALDDGNGILTVPWQDIKKIRSDRRMIYVHCIKPKLFYSSAWSLRGEDVLIIPKSAFLSSNASEEFVAAVTVYQHGENPVLTGETTWPPAPDSQRLRNIKS